MAENQVVHKGECQARRPRALDAALIKVKALEGSSRWTGRRLGGGGRGGSPATPVGGDGFCFCDARLISLLA